MAVLCAGINRDVVYQIVAFSQADNEFCSIFLDSERIFLDACRNATLITLIDRLRASIFRKSDLILRYRVSMKHTRAVKRNLLRS